jgi:hypothetical protein
MMPPSWRRIRRCWPALHHSFVRFDLAVFPLIGRFIGSFLFGRIANYLIAKYQ